VIISASRRTDLPAYHSREFMAGIKAGFIEVPHPRNPGRASRVSLRPEDVEAIVFWTRDPRPLFPYLDELEARGFFYYFQFTLLDNPPLIDPGGPGRAEAVAAFRALSDRIGPERVVWRYDPIIFSERAGLDVHRRKFEELASALAGATRRVMISLVDFYRSVVPRLRRLEKETGVIRPPTPEDLTGTIPAMAAVAAAHGMEIFSCAEEIDLLPFGVRPGKCIDARLISRLTGRTVPSRKDPRQRKACGCDESRDIGVYGTCPRGCVYCYARSPR